ncbi:TonB-dependent receptor domain-containing protein [Aurantiacibacter sediminis]|uniref:TonB-dependent receptor n=1 Tax=Aurantiacibacter sediminis TaxID=2793064 RepID=A0ABS0N6G3_9SPHN|nr:TonB-dependent receptor [Aurantiacibacter sediminis]MBH5323357.1 TonB-dependent receptor [Aurantiacibacter sediminis]
MKLRTALRSASAPIALSIACLANPALAQDADDEPSAEEQEGSIVVLGSRIQRDPNEAAPSPVSTISIDDIRETGVIDATEALREIPALSNSGTISDSLQNGAGGIGQATLNLRGLGSVRTLVLVNGQRHVSGVAGSQIVDVSSIPTGLIERVDVLTGGASAVYGADAVTGVVNYVLREDFDGFEIDATGGVSAEGDGWIGAIDGAVGFNAPNGRGNVTLAAGYSYTEQLLQGDRDFFANNGRFNTGTTYPSPLLRFQRGDISDATPNFQDFYSIANFSFPIGFRIPLPGTPEYDAIFSGGTTPTAAEQALIDQALGAPALAYQSDPRFAISSGAGLIFRRDFGFFDADINNNGINDCQESFIGLTGFGGGGCYVSTPGGGVKIFEDGIVASSSNQFGGDGAPERVSGATLVPGNERVYAALLANYDVTDGINLFVDAKYVNSYTESQNPYNTFYDSLLIYADNPFIPDVLQADADDAGGLRVSRDFTDLGLARQLASRETYRIVSGLRGEFGSGSEFSWQLSANYGRFESEIENENTVLPDRLFAAIDAVDEGQFLNGTPNGNIVCRSDLDPDARHPGSQFFPVIEPGFFTFNPGDGSCRPASLFNGEQSVSQEAVDFISVTTVNEAVLEQFVLSASLGGDTSSFFELPGGPVRFAVGAEYREEKSSFEFDPLVLGIAPIDTPDISAGQFIGDVSANQQLVFDAQTRSFNTGGQFDVAEIFAEVNIPILEAVPFFDVLELTGAARYSDYSTVGGTFTWSVSGIWAPIEDVRFRGTYSRAVRAPNISELFDPEQGTVFRPSDPCDVSQIAVLDAADAANRQANCVADFQALGAAPSDYSTNGVYDYSDPLTARFSGTTGGNPDLLEETATTYTFGALITPRFIPGLLLSVDYYNIEIEDAIAAVGSQDIVDTCYDSTAFPNQFCGQFDRNGDPTSPTFLGFNFLRQTQLNFGRIETAGIDGTIAYRFDIGDFDIGARASVNWVDYIDRFFDPTDPTNVDPELREEQRPEWAGVGSLTVGYGPFSLRYGLQYVGSTAFSGIEIETAEAQVGPAGFADEYWIHDISVSYEANDDFTIYAGVNNLTDEQPYPTNFSYPVSPYGTSFFLGITLRGDQIPGL